MTDSTRRPGRRHTSSNGRGDFPLFKHQSGRWCKKIRGKHCYFGKVADDPDGQAAMARYLDQKDDLYAGRVPRAKGGGLTVRDLVNRFLTAKRHLLDAGEIRPCTWKDYYLASERIVRVLGPDRLVSDLVPEDFERLRSDLARTRGPEALAVDVTRVRMVFKYGWDNGMILSHIRYGTAFARPSKKVLRIARAERGPKMFDVVEIRRMLNAASVPLRAMLLLGINCAFGPADLGRLPLSALDLDGGWVRFPRPKTGIDRRCPLWPQTVEALREAIHARPKPKHTADAQLVFLTGPGGSWHTNAGHNAVTWQTRKLLASLELQRPGRGFYSLRHTFLTIADQARDPAAISQIMGHAPAANDMSAVYRERIDDERLRAVVEHVRTWLFGGEKTP